jgi:hypothetical protein
LKLFWKHQIALKGVRDWRRLSYQAHSKKNHTLKIFQREAERHAGRQHQKRLQNFVAMKEFKDLRPLRCVRSQTPRAPNGRTLALPRAAKHGWAANQGEGARQAAFLWSSRMPWPGALERSHGEFGVQSVAGDRTHYPNQHPFRTRSV